GFNPDNTLGTQTLSSSGGATLANWSYSYDAAYRITDQNFSGQAASGGALVNGNSHYGYDAASRVSSFTAPGAAAKAVSWDHSGNRLGYGTLAYTYNADNSIASSTDSAVANSTHSFTYMPFGGLASDGCSNDAYDGFDRLTQNAGASGTACPAPQTASYTYDGLDRQRIQSQPSGATSLHYDGL
ncbi:MAG: hypothetical protein M3O87_00140, partial [Candidatus Dormibacteraeota bacterium]|nr:hypothetical protein [Candidatus Dormibacteraeota bacterium]